MIQRIAKAVDETNLVIKFQIERIKPEAREMAWPFIKTLNLWQGLLAYKKDVSIGRSLFVASYFFYVQMDYVTSRWFYIKN